jgi:hypothetical protein
VQHLEGSAGAGLGLSLSFPWLSLAVGYSPGVTVIPLESSPRDVILSDTLSAGAATGYTFHFRRASLSLSQTAGYTLQNPVLQSIAGPPPAQPTLPPLGGTGGDDGTGGGGKAGGKATTPPDASAAANARRAENYRVQSWALRSSVAFERALSRVTSFTADAGYSLGAGLGSSRPTNPLVQGPDAGIGVGYRASSRDNLTTSLHGAYGWSEEHTHGQIVTLDERWGHDFNRHTHSELGAGVAYTRSWTGDGAVLNGIYPVGTASIGYTTRLARGMLGLGAGVTTGPVLDVTTATVDPRLGAAAAVGWSRDRVSLGANLSSAISLSGDPNGPGTFNSLTSSLTMTYDIGAGFSANAGVRSAWQRFEGVTIVNPTSVIFIGLSWGAATTLIEPAHRATPL